MGKGYKIGMSKPIVAKYAYNPNTKKVTYSEAIYLGEAMTGTFTPNYASAQLYADDHLVDESNELKNIGIALGISRLPIKAHNVLYGAEVDGDEVTERTTDVSNEVGLGFISRQTGGTYTAIVLMHATFSRGAESYSTKGENVTYNTPTVNGTAMESEDDEDNRIRKFRENMTKEDALQYVKDILGNPDELESPGTEEPESPGTEEPESPGTEEPESPGTEEPESPGTEEQEEEA